MASTYSWQDGITLVRPYIKSIPTSTIDVAVCDQANSFLWRRFPWRWAQASLTSGSGVLTLVDGVQDYALGTLTGAGFFQLLRVRITRTDVTPWISREKDITNWLAPNLEQMGSIDSIKAICFEPVSGGLRLECAASVPSGTSFLIDGEYQFQPVKVTSTSTPIVFPDQYFETVTETLKWKYFQLGDDKREPEQRALAMALVQQMVKDEDYGDAPGTRFPSDGVGVTQMGSSGLFGFY